MAAAEDLTRSLAYEPRRQFLDFHSRSKRWAIIVAHRRAGKTVACVVELLTRAIATAKLDARYAYIAPYREQAKTVAWSYLKHYATPLVRDPEKDFRESELAVRLFNGSIVRLFGADNPNALRGMYLDGVVMDEYADMRPSLWGEVIRPTLSDRNGWAVFIGTPRGRNAFWELYDKAGRDDTWMRVTLKASETEILSEKELQDARKTITESQYQQEYECDFEAAIKGAVYAKELGTYADHIRPVPYDASALVHTAWDLGKGDATAIWFFQKIAGEIRVIDFYESSGEMLPFYHAKLQSKGYHYDTAWLPHDGKHETMTGLSVLELTRAAGFRAELLAKIDVEEGINAARMIFPRTYFDESKCAKGLDALRAYRWAYNARMDEVKPTPVHNWASHAADAFRYLAQAAGKSSGPLKLPPLVYPKNL